MGKHARGCRGGVKRRGRPKTFNEILRAKMPLTAGRIFDEVPDGDMFEAVLSFVALPMGEAPSHPYYVEQPVAYDEEPTFSTEKKPASLNPEAATFRPPQHPRVIDECDSAIELLHTDTDFEQCTTHLRDSTAG